MKFSFQFQNWIKANFTLSYRVCRQNLSIYIFEAQKKARNVYRVRERNKKTHVKYKPWRKLGRILRGRCTRASRVPRESIAGRGPWPMGTARWCPPEKHGWQFHSAPSVEEIALPPLNWVGVLRAMKGRRAGVDSLDGIHEDKKRKRAEATHAPLSSFPFQFSCCRLLPGQIQPSSYLRRGRGFQVVSGRPTSRRSALNRPLPLLDKDPS